MSGISSENLIATVSGTEAAGTSTLQAQDKSGQNSDNSFAELLADVIEGQASAQLTDAVSCSSSSSESALGTLGLMNSGGDALSALLTSFSDSEGGDSELGIMLLYMLMNMNSGSDSGMMMLSSLLSASAGDRSYGADVRSSVSNGNIFDTLVGDSGVSGADSNSGSNTTWTGSEALPLNCWIPTSPLLTGNSSCRSAELLDDIIEQFDVESSARYTPHKYGGDTYCNIFVWDVSSALGCEIPHWVDGETMAPRQYPDIKGAVELGANATYGWLEEYGDDYGWIEVTAEQAQEYANKGYPAVTTWKNPGGGAGHVQIVRPSEDGAYDESRGVSVAQAGGHNYEYTYTGSIYSSSSLSRVRYYVHA